jgi:hypothetical protein
MKKIALVLTLGLFVHLVPMKAFAAYSPISHGGNIMVALFVFFGTGNMSVLSENTMDQNGALKEFAALNSIPENLALLSQEAGGAMSTLDILK